MIHQHVTFCRCSTNTNGPQLGQQKTRPAIQYCLFVFLLPRVTFTFMSDCHIFHNGSQLVNGSAISIVTGLHIFLGHNCSLSVDATNIAYILAVFIDGQYNYEKKMFISRLTTQLQKFSNLSSHLL